MQLSTDFVFSGKNGPYAEDDLPDPPNFYGRTKLEAEKLVQENSKTWSIIRTVLVYGYASAMDRSNIVLLVKNKLEAGQSLRIVNDQFRTPTLAEDLALGCRLIIKNKQQGIYHISGDEMYSIYEIARETARFFNLNDSLLSPVSTKALNEKYKRPLKTGFILDKAKQRLNYQPKTLRQGLEILKKQLT